MASRFQEVTDADVSALKDAAENENTRKSTVNWVRVFEKWCDENGLEKNPEKVAPDQLDKLLERFFASARKQDGTDYEPGSLRVMQAALDRHLKEKGYSFSIMKDREFFNSRKVLEGKARKLRNEGKGKLPNKSRSLTREEEEALWESGQLGNLSPRSLINTMWWLLSQHLGLRGCQEHYTMNVEDFTLNKDDSGNEFVTFAEGPTKTRQGGLRVQPRSVLPKMFATGDARCPVALFKHYLSKRPEDVKLSGPFYLACIDSPTKTEVWYKKSRMVRKTVVRKLKAKGVPKSDIITITGHRQEQSVEAYDSGNEDEQRQLSNIIDGKEIQLNQTTSRAPLQPLIQSNAAVSSGHVYHFHSCNVVINQGQASASSSLPSMYNEP
ncbi:hypothetical protein ACROYT_G012221 [Oculina patagonica]